MICKIWRFTCDLHHRTVTEHHCSSLAAALSFYAILSFFPFVILIVSVLSYFAAASDNVLLQLQEYIAKSLPVSATGALEVLTSTVAAKTVYGIVGLAGIVWGSTRIFSVTEAAMNRIWTPKSTRGFWESRFISLISIPFLGVFLTASVTITGVISLVRSEKVRFLNTSLADFPLIDSALSHIVPIALSTILFTSVYYLLPKRWDHLRSAFYGAVLAAVFWEIAKVLFDYYISHFSHLQTIYGSFASLAILIFWVYYSSYLILIGAEFGALLHERRAATS